MPDPNRYGVAKTERGAIIIHRPPEPLEELSPADARGLAAWLAAVAGDPLVFRSELAQVEELCR